MARKHHPVTVAEEILVDVLEELRGIRAALGAPRPSGEVSDEVSLKEPKPELKRRTTTKRTPRTRP